MTSRDLEKPGSECDLTTLVRRLGVTTSMKKACNREIRSFYCASVMSVLIHSDLVKVKDSPVDMLITLYCNDLSSSGSATGDLAS